MQNESVKKEPRARQAKPVDTKAMRAFYDRVYAAGEYPLHSPEVVEAAVWSRVAQIPRHQMVLDVGCGAGPLRTCHPGYIGLDLSHSALRHFAGRRLCADASALPLRDRAIGAVASITTIEHLCEPVRFLLEADRVLLSGGILIISAGWLVSRWTAFGLRSRPWHDCSWADRLRKLCLLLISPKPVRAIAIIPRRAFRELEFLLRRRQTWRLRYRHLRPNTSRLLESDSDAAVSIDPHEVLLWLRSRDYQVERAGSLFSRLLFRGTILARKPSP